MTIEKLLNCSADELDKFTGAQLTEWFAPLIPKTRPDLVVKQAAEQRMTTSSSKKQKVFAEQMEFEKRMAEARKIAASRGVKL